MTKTIEFKEAQVHFMIGTKDSRRILPLIPTTPTFADIQAAMVRIAEEDAASAEAARVQS